MSQAFNHRHLVLKATGLRSPGGDPVDLGRWLESVVAAVRMKVLAGPFVVRCDTPGNEGATGAVVIETSHCSVHVWERRDASPDGPYLQFDLYSCAWFGSGEVLDLVLKAFRPAHVGWTVFDRNGAMAEMAEEGTWEALF